MFENFVSSDIRGPQWELECHSYGLASSAVSSNTIALLLLAPLAIAQQPLNWAKEDGNRGAALEKDGFRLEGEHAILWCPRSLARADAEEILKRVDPGVAGLWRRVGTHAWQAVPKGRITHYLSEDTFVAHASDRGAVFVPMARVRDGRAPFLHVANHPAAVSAHFGGISKRGDVYLRCLLTHGARSLLLTARRTARAAPSQVTRVQQWALAVAARRGHNKAAIAVANKLAGIIWAVWSRDIDFDSAAGGKVAA